LLAIVGADLTGLEPVPDWVTTNRSAN